MTKPKLQIVWFRQDLRVADNPALRAAAKAGIVLPIYILDDKTPGPWKMGAASRVWLHYSLQDLSKSLSGNLGLFKGDPFGVFKGLSKNLDIEGVYWNRCYEPWRTTRDKALKVELEEDGVLVKTFNGSLLWEPWTILKGDKTPYKVFSPFYYKKCLQAPTPLPPEGSPDKIRYFERTRGQKLETLNLLPKNPAWHKRMVDHWDISETGALERLEGFLDNGLAGYKAGRNIPGAEKISRLSPYLHFGQISPHAVWHRVRSRGDGANEDHFCSELGWREFSYYLLYHFPELPRKNFQPKFNAFPWVKDDKVLSAWQKGQTGIPIVDAGMRELWHTGFMHNRVRMIAASFLTKNLLHHWHEGEQWFWDTLFDADLANNSASWQWVAGSGADAAPYFRIFNPVSQAEKFDPEGIYIKRWVPELKNLRGKALFSPWEASSTLLAKAGVILGENYPYPIVDLKKSREGALEAYRQFRSV